MADVPIPFPLWKRLQEFLQSGATGQIILDVNAGKVSALSLNERVRVREADASTSGRPDIATSGKC